MIKLPADPIIVVNTNDLTRDQWLEMRKTGIGGSEAAGCKGASKWSSPLLIYMDKHDMLPEKEDNDFMEFGREAEPFIRDFFQKKMRAQGIEITVSEFPYMMRSKTHDFMLANIDGICTYGDEVVGLEIKTADTSMRKYWADHQIPEMYYWQVQHYMAVTGLNAFWVVCLLGRSLIWRLVFRNDYMTESLIADERTVWDMVIAGEMPAPSGLEGEVSALKEGIGYKAGDIVEEKTGEYDELISKRDVLGQEIKDSMFEKTIIDARLLQLMNGAKTLMTNKYKVVHLISERKTFNKNEFAKIHPDLAESFTEKRVVDMGFRVYERKGA